MIRKQPYTFYVLFVFLGQSETPVGMLNLHC